RVPARGGAAAAEALADQDCAQRVPQPPPARGAPAAGGAVRGDARGDARRGGGDAEARGAPRGARAAAVQPARRPRDARARGALVAAAGVVAGAIGPVVGASDTHQRKPAAVALSPLTVASAKRAEVTTAPAAIRVLRGPMVVVKRQGRTFVVTEGSVGTGAPVPFQQQQIELGGGGPAPAAQPLAGATGPADTPGTVASEPSATSATQAVTTT